MSTINVRNAHIRSLLPELHRSLIDIMVIMNRPERDVELLTKAGLSLERALFPLLVLVERLGPVGVVDLAGSIGRDHTTVSRQVARLEELGLVTRRAGATDKRIREALITSRGKEVTDTLDAAREEIATVMFEDWKQKEIDDLARLMRKLVETMR